MNLKFSIKPQATKPSIQTFDFHQEIFGSVLGKILSWKMYPSPQPDLAKVANEIMTVTVYHVLLQCLVNLLHPSLHPEGDPLPLHIQQKHLYHSCPWVTPCSSRQLLSLGPKLNTKLGPHTTTHHHHPPPPTTSQTFRPLPGMLGG